MIENSSSILFENWVKNSYLPYIKLNSFIKNVYLLELMTEIDDRAKSYSIQMVFESIVYYNQFLLENEEEFVTKIQNQFIGKIFTFSTLLKEII